MSIIVNLDVMLAKRKMKLQDLAQAVNNTVQNISNIKTVKAKAIAAGLEPTGDTFLFQPQVVATAGRSLAGRAPPLAGEPPICPPPPGLQSLHSWAPTG
jgi:hypothetical protein